MKTYIDFFYRRPLVCAVVAIFSLLDAANCIRLEHDDSWFPMVVAFVFALGIRPVDRENQR